MKSWIINRGSQQAVGNTEYAVLLGIKVLEHSSLQPEPSTGYPSELRKPTSPFYHTIGIVI